MDFVTAIVILLVCTLLYVVLTWIFSAMKLEVPSVIIAVVCLLIAILMLTGDIASPFVNRR